MLHILFLILKIIGIILLVLLGILVLSLCVILYVPVRYELKTETKNGIEGLSVRVNAFWLFRCTTAFIDYHEKNFKWQIRFFWKKWNSEEQSTAEENDEAAASDEMTDAEPGISTEKAATKEQTSDKEQSQTTKKKKKKENFFTKIKCTIKKICDRIKSIWNKKEKVVDFLKDEIHLTAFNKAKKEILILIKHLRPRTMKGFVRFGLEDPYNTGRVLAVLSTLYPFYGDKVQIYPEFDREILEGDLYIKGRIHIIRLVIVLWNLFFDKNIRKTYQDYKKIKSEFSGGN